MNAFQSARTVEARALARILPFLEEQSDEGHYVLTDKGRLAPMLQRVVGDALFNSKRDQKMWSVEFKAEQTWTGNLFLETWSNRNLENVHSHAERGSNPGWMLKLRSDLLFYYFLDADRLLVMDLFALKRWAFTGGDRGAGNIWDYRAVSQKRYSQLNDTWGHLVPVSALRVQLATPVREFTASQLSLLPEAGI